MDKQMIERIAPLVQAAIAQGPLLPAKGERQSLAESITALVIERIDAERGKLATAWLHDITHNDDPRQHDEALAFTPDAFPMDGCGLFTSAGSRPLFLSPTIPEGMALVPIEPTQEMLKAADDGDREYTTRNFGADMQTIPQGAYDHYCAMIAAAQGERNAD